MNKQQFIETVEAILKKKNEIIDYVNNVLVDYHKHLDPDTGDATYYFFDNLVSTIKIDDSYDLEIGWGICSNLLYTVNFEYCEDAIFGTWPKFSGSFGTPVPGYSEYDKLGGLAKWANPDRWDLLEHILKCVKEDKHNG